MEKYGMDSFCADLEEMNLSITQVQIKQFYRYYELLAQWNQVINLTAITDFEDILKKHFVDSLTLVQACDLHGNDRMIDVGTGAGFPGLALKIAFPDVKVTLLDSLAKRIHFLDVVIAELGLSGVETVHGRAEDLAGEKKYREAYDVCVSRAVANLSTLSEYCLPFVKTGGLFVSYKSDQVSDELSAAEHAVSLLGGAVEKQVKLTLPHSDICRNLILIRKCAGTPAGYPRKAGLPSRRPL